MISHFFLTLYHFFPVCTTLYQFFLVTYRCVPLRPHACEKRWQRLPLDESIMAVRWSVIPWSRGPNPDHRPVAAVGPGKGSERRSVRARPSVRARCVGHSPSSRIAFVF